MERRFNINYTNEQLNRYRAEFDKWFERYSKDHSEFKEVFDKYPEKKEDYFWKWLDSQE